MRELNSPPPAMSHSPAYYQQYRSSNNSSPAPRSQPFPQRPPPAQVAMGRADKLPHNHEHIKASVSSATSGSTDATDPRSYSPPQAYQYASEAERGHMQGRSPRQVHMSPAVSDRVSNSHRHTREMVQATPDTVIRYIQHDADEDDIEEPDHAIWILFWMSLLDPFYSFFSCIFTIITLFVLVVISPIRLCRTEWSFSTSLIRTVCPVYRKHLQLLCTESVKNAHNFEFSTGKLIFIHLIAPVVSICFTFFCWIAAIFWLFAIMMGNPDGTEKRDDGRATVLMARNKWETILLVALRRW